MQDFFKTIPLLARFCLTEINSGAIFSLIAVLRTLQCSKFSPANPKFWANLTEMTLQTKPVLILLVYFLKSYKSFKKKTFCT